MMLLVQIITFSVLIILAGIAYTVSLTRREPLLALFGILFSVVAGTYASVMWALPAMS